MKDITKKIMKDPTILANPMERLKEDLAANPEAAAAAKQLLPKLKALLPTSAPPADVLETPKPKKKGGKKVGKIGGSPDYRKLMMKAMKDKVIAQTFANPKYAPITKKIMKDPSKLTIAIGNAVGDSC